MKNIIIVLCLLFLLSHCTTNKVSSDEDEIRSKLNQWVLDYQNRDMAGVKSIFSKNLIGSYQGSPDQTYDDIENSYWFGNDTISANYHLTIEEIQIEKNLGFVRDTWAYYELNNKTQVVDTVLRVRSYEIWQKENDEWKITRWISYPIQQSP